MAPKIGSIPFKFDLELRFHHQDKIKKECVSKTGGRGRDKSFSKRSSKRIKTCQEDELQKLIIVEVEAKPFQVVVGGNVGEEEKEKENEEEIEKENKEETWNVLRGNAREEETEKEKEEETEKEEEEETRKVREQKANVDLPRDDTY
ncbi:uncharacterized protein LOC107819582 [Nicotiana tabacum]|uniref:Uncharacterized protein LOC107819582 n=1 Tax=Nicotiana tabacum TaxID=4097 RepID=A0A1S4CJ00_TOBAC|nr:PREDICTED: vicilin-like seed storage protein At2g18540 [Nicotiana tabacum]